MAIRLIASSDFDHRFYIYNHLPDKSGTLPDKIIDTRSFNLFAWDHVLYKNILPQRENPLLQSGMTLDKIHLRPDIQFNNQIGTAVFTDLKGIALDSNFLYLADRSGKVYIWKGIPSDQSTNPDFTFDYGAVELSRLSSDGEYFLCYAAVTSCNLHLQVTDLFTIRSESLEDYQYFWNAESSS